MERDETEKGKMCKIQYQMAQGKCQMLSMRHAYNVLKK